MSKNSTKLNLRRIHFVHSGAVKRDNSELQAKNLNIYRDRDSSPAAQNDILFLR